MNALLNAFEKRHDYLICIDSDGCAVDNLEVKHRQCFGPCLIQEWQLKAWREEVLALWEKINLHSLTRGVNRFRALALALTEINQTWKHIPYLNDYLAWLENTEEFTADSLAKEAELTSSPILKKALRWSEESNRAIAAILPEERRAFGGVREALASVRAFADIAVVSSANHSAVTSEWTFAGLIENVDVFLCQEAGNKTRCIAQLKKKGYDESHILMVGDAPSDRASAELNGVFFYPVQARHEQECWMAFPQAAAQFREGVYQSEERRLSEAFIMNLAGGNTND